MTSGQAVSAPGWFVSALAAPSSSHTITVDGQPVVYRRWGSAPRGLVLIHGGGAHSHWWDHIAPWFVTTERCVLALDLSGHGGSGHRSGYSLSQWVDEALAVCGDAGLVDAPVLAGHSLGGWVATFAAADHPDAVSGLIVMDSRLIDPVDENAPPAEPVPSTRPLRIYPSYEEITARYRPLPPQDGNLPFVIEHLARTSVCQVEGGWTWKFDQVALAHTRPGPATLARIHRPSAIIRGDRGLITPDILAAMTTSFGVPTPVINVPLAGHHLMLDQPLSLVTALRSVLTMWEQGKQGA